MAFRKALMAGSLLLLPVAAYAQAPTEPVTGLYLGAAGGFNIKSNPNVNHITSNLPGAGGLTTPNLNLSTGIGGAAMGSIGYGLGNGIRLELEFDYRGNSFSRTSGNNRSGSGVSTGTSGSEKLWGPMFNALYDFNNVIPYVTPYVGLGLGYQRAHLSDFSAGGSGPGEVTVTSNYRIMALTGTRTYNAGLTTTTATGTTTRFGTFQLGHDLNNTFLFGLR